jgi:hypothetical protein
MMPATAVTRTTVVADTPKRMMPIFTPAITTDPRMSRLKTNPRYTARNARRNAAGLPE